jgi:hypothetical protein
VALRREGEDLDFSSGQTRLAGDDGEFGPLPLGGEVDRVLEHLTDRDRNVLRRRAICDVSRGARGEDLVDRLVVPAHIREGDHLKSRRSLSRLPHESSSILATNLAVEPGDEEVRRVLVEQLECFPRRSRPSAHVDVASPQEPDEDV